LSASKRIRVELSPDGPMQDFSHAADDDVPGGRRE
jgi:hypothetical protein